MRIFQTREFAKFVRRNSVAAEQLLACVDRLAAGSFDANLGSGLYKQRISRQGGGKSGGFRTILVYRSEDRAVFLHGFAKNVQANVSSHDLRLLRLLSKRILQYTQPELDEAVVAGEFEELP